MPAHVLAQRERLPTARNSAVELGCAFLRVTRFMAISIRPLVEPPLAEGAIELRMIVAHEAVGS